MAFEKPLPAFPASGFNEAALKDGTVAVNCKILKQDLEAQSALASDGFQEAILNFERPEDLKKARAGEFARIFGKAFFKDSQVLINVESLQLVDGEFSAQSAKVLAMEKKAGVF